MKAWRSLLSMLLAALLLVSACSPRVVTVTVTSPPETVVVTATARSTPTPADVAPEERPNVLNVCLVGEPDTLYLYGGSELPATLHVMEAIYDGPIDHRDYGYQPVILEKLPSLRDGDALTRTVFVRRGRRVVGADGEVIELDEGVRVRPSGCYTTGCEIVYDRGLVRMDRLEVTFALRDDVTWSDGEPLTADDSVFGFEVASNPATPGYRYLTARTEEYEAADQLHAKWTGVPGFLDSSYMVRFFPPLPRHQLAGIPVSELPTYDGTRRMPLGWGPFVVEEWIPGDRISVSRNPAYFRVDEDLPLLDRVVFNFMADREEVVTGLLTGSCHVGTHDSDFGSLMRLLTRLEEESLLRVVSAPGNGLTLLSLGVEPAEQYVSPDFFADPRVRQAVALCVDRTALIDEITFGRGVTSESYLPPMHPLHPGDELTNHPYDPVAGQALLDDIGWRDEDGDGVRESHDVNGILEDERFEVMLLTSAGGEQDQEAARMLRAQLADCGIRVALDALPRWELTAAGPDGPFFGRRFDMAETVWWLGDHPPCDWYAGSEIPQSGAWDGSNVTGYRTPAYDMVCDSARRSLPGTEPYEEYHREAQIIFSRDLPAIPLFSSLRIALAAPRVEGLRMDATSPSELWNLEELTIRDLAVSP